MGVVSGVRKTIQDLVAPELKEVGVKLETLSQNQGAMETRLLKAIVKSEEEILLLMVQVTNLSQQNELLLKQVSELKKTAQ